MVKPKEDRSGWVAVQPEFSQGAGGADAPPPIKPPTSSYNFFQKENSAKIRSDLAAAGQSTDLGSLGRAISDRWKALSPDERAHYDALARDDMMRFNRESHLRDVEVMQRREAQAKARENLILETEDGLRTTRKALRKEKRKKDKKEKKKDQKKKSSSAAVASSAAGGSAAAAAHGGVEFDDSDSSASVSSNDGDESSSSDSSYDSDDPDGSKKKRADRQPRQLSEAARIRRDEARAEKAAKEAYIEERQEELRQDRAAQAKRRLDFLLKQSDIFSHFGSVKEDTTSLGMNKNQRQKVATEAKGGDGVVISHRDRRSEVDAATTAMTEEAELEEGDEHEATFLTTQPSTLGFGTMRPYQLEGLNWMIRLQENGVNGILADEMG